MNLTEGWPKVETITDVRLLLGLYLFLAFLFLAKIAYRYSSRANQAIFEFALGFFPRDVRDEILTTVLVELKLKIAQDKIAERRAADQLV